MQRLLRRLEYLGLEALGLGFRHPWIMRLVQQVGLLHLRRSVPSASLRAALTPSYTIGCKRLLMSNTYYPALAQSNVSVHPTAVAGFDGREVIGADGVRAEVDVVVLGTGFRILDLPVATTVSPTPLPPPLNLTSPTPCPHRPLTSPHQLHILISHRLR